MNGELLVTFEMVRALTPVPAMLLAQELECKAQGEEMRVYILNEEFDLYLLCIRKEWWIAKMVTVAQI